MSKLLNVNSLIIAAALALPSIAFADDEVNVVSGFTAAGAPLALHGIDPVASIEIGNPIEGEAKFTAVHNGAAYYFSSKANLDAFNKNPDKYVPQNGGFCTFGVSVGKKFDGDPQYASIEDGKLYVFLNEDIFKMFLKDKQGTIKKAEKQWNRIEHLAAKTL